MLVDGGAPQISVAQDEIERQASYWQDQARFAAERAHHFAWLAGSLKLAYRQALAAAHVEARS